MATRKIVKVGDETLRKVCRPQEKFDLRLWILLKDMADTMYKAEGVGLAAPQVGVLRRVCIVMDTHRLRISQGPYNRKRHYQRKDHRHGEYRPDRKFTLACKKQPT